MTSKKFETLESNVSRICAKYQKQKEDSISEMESSKEDSDSALFHTLKWNMLSMFTEYHKHALWVEAEAIVEMEDTPYYDRVTRLISLFKRTRSYVLHGSGGKTSVDGHGIEDRALDAARKDLVVQLGGLLKSLDFLEERQNT